MKTPKIAKGSLVCIKTDGLLRLLRVTKVNKKSLWGRLANESGRLMPGAEPEMWKGETFHVIDKLTQFEIEADEDGFERLPRGCDEDPC